MPFDKEKLRKPKGPTGEALEVILKPVFDEETLEPTKEEINERAKEENNVAIKEEKKKQTNEGKKTERKRVSFDLRVDLHKEFKILAVTEDKNIYEMIEEAMEKYLEERKK